MKKTNKLRQRVSAVILKDKSILLIKRIKPGQEYYIFPGGGVEEGETLEEALRREVAEELSLKVIKGRPIFSLTNLPIPEMITVHKGNRDENYFLVREYDGIPEIGGPEKERMNNDNQYHLEWVSLAQLDSMSNLYPKEGVGQLLKFLHMEK